MAHKTIPKTLPNFGSIGRLRASIEMVNLDEIAKGKRSADPAYYIKNPPISLRTQAGLYCLLEFFSYNAEEIIEHALELSDRTDIGNIRAAQLAIMLTFGAQNDYKGMALLMSLKSMRINANDAMATLIDLYDCDDQRLIDAIERDTLKADVIALRGDDPNWGSRTERFDYGSAGLLLFDHSIADRMKPLLPHLSHYNTGRIARSVERFGATKAARNAPLVLGDALPRIAKILRLPHGRAEAILGHALELSQGSDLENIGAAVVAEHLLTSAGVANCIDLLIQLKESGIRAEEAFMVAGNTYEGDAGRFIGAIVSGEVKADVIWLCRQDRHRDVRLLPDINLRG